MHFLFKISYISLIPHMEAITSDRVFEVIGVYFANCYWNNLYKSAKDLYLEGNIDSIEEAYRTAIERYHKAFCTVAVGPNGNKYYDELIKDLHNNYKFYLQTGGTLMDFIDTCTSFFLPRDYYKKMARLDPKKVTIFRQIITKTVTKFTTFLLQEEVARAVKKDVRSNQDAQKQSIEAWKKKFIEIMVGERNEFCSLIMASTSGVNIKNKEDIPSIPKEVCDKMQNKIKTLIAEKAAITSDYNKLVGLIGELKRIIKDKDTLIESLKAAQTQQPTQYRRQRPPRQPMPVIVTNPTAMTAPAPTPAPTTPPAPAPVPTPTPTTSAPPSAPAETNQALEQLSQEEFPDEESVEPAPQQAVEEAGDLPSDGELQADD
jgi:hypothetical protein